MASTQRRGAGLFDLRRLSTATLLNLHDVLHVVAKPEAEFFATVRRILRERDELS